ncbi:polysaccharide deacetylase family protein [uncultured Desulfuromonas sp.]|uniref:polysaccharide deacetylase family protein n=1 Tax=uncultured Desulfuromonas sp. TaxID=181013 RepID=UPI002AAAD077|nr:polysaccharide deacetylase family protein [uncultured Desulfuromonas sp.]
MKSLSCFDFFDLYIYLDSSLLNGTVHDLFDYGKPSTEKKYININNSLGNVVWENLPSRSSKLLRSKVYQVLLKTALSGHTPLIQKWYWPNGARSFFSLRADMDAGEEKSLLQFVEAVSSWPESLSFFVCGKAYVGKEKVLKCVADLGAEIGNHTYTHYVFSDRGRNRINLELTEQLLASVAVDPKGYVGPASFFHTSMYDVLEEKGYDYTSSFGLSHDDYPFFPMKQNSDRYGMVEIPFYCLGDRFPKFDLELDGKNVWSFFEQLLEKKYHDCEPMFIYGHPDMVGRMGDHPDLVKFICEKALSYDDIYTGNMADISSWWRRRHETTADIFYDRENNRVVAQNYHGSEDVYWSVQIDESSKYLVSGNDLQNGVRLNDLGMYKKIDLKKSPYAEIGEVIDRPRERISLRTKIANFRREYRRRQRMIRELDMAKKG